MKTKLTMMVAMTAVCAATQLTAMPTEEETRLAEPVVKKQLAGERAALKSGRKTRSEVAVAAMKLADEADSDAAKLLLMKGAFVLYVRDSNLEKAVETMKALEAAIADMPPQSVTNMIEMALLGVSKKSDGARLYKLLGESKMNAAENEVPRAGTYTNESATETVADAPAPRLAPKPTAMPGPKELLLHFSSGGEILKRAEIDYVKGKWRFVLTKKPEWVESVFFCNLCDEREIGSGNTYVSWSSTAAQKCAFKVKVNPNETASKREWSFVVKGDDDTTVCMVRVSQDPGWNPGKVTGRWPDNQSESSPIRYIGEEERNSIASILKGMIKVPGRDYWLSATELTQGQWESVMGNNPSSHKGANLPVENVSRNDCDVFLKKLNATKEVQTSRFEFRLPELEEWKYAAWAGSAAMRFSSSPASNVLDMAWVKENSLNQTHAVASKAPNAFGFYDMFGNVWEWLSGDVSGGRGALKGCAFNQVADKCTWNQNWYMPKTQRHCYCGLRLAAHVRILPTFALNATPGSITELNLGKVPPLQFVYCPAGKFSMGYKEQPALSKVKDVEITSPFWVSKIPIRADQLESLGLNSITNAQTGDAVINNGSIVVQKLPSALKERFGKMLPPGYVFRLPTEAEFEYLQKAEKKDGDGQTNIWGVERLYSGGYIGLLDRAPAYGKGVDVVNRKSRGTVWTDLEKVSYEKQPDKDPVGWSNDPNWSVFRRGLARNCGGGKLLTTQRNSYQYGFYFVVAPDIDKLNKFYWK